MDAHMSFCWRTIVYLVDKDNTDLILEEQKHRT